MSTIPNTEVAIWRISKIYVGRDPYYIYSSTLSGTPSRGVGVACARYSHCDHWFHWRYSISVPNMCQGLVNKGFNVTGHLPYKSMSQSLYPLNDRSQLWQSRKSYQCFTIGVQWVRTSSYSILTLRLIGQWLGATMQSRKSFQPSPLR